MKSRISVLALAVLLSPLACAASEPLFYMPLDGSADVVGSDGGNLKGGVVYGKSGYVAGVSGKALEVKRHAYDQVTAVNFAGLPEADWNEGTGVVLVQAVLEGDRPREHSGIYRKRQKLPLLFR